MRKQDIFSFSCWAGVESAAVARIFKSSVGRPMSKEEEEGGKGLILRREGNGRVRDFPHFTTQRFSFRESRVLFWIVSRIRYLLPREELCYPGCLFSWLFSSVRRIPGHARLVPILITFCPPSRYTP